MTGRRCSHTLTKSDFRTAGAGAGGTFRSHLSPGDYGGRAILRTGDQRPLRDTRPRASVPPDQTCPERPQVLTPEMLGDEAFVVLLAAQAAGPGYERSACTQA